MKNFRLQIFHGLPLNLFDKSQFPILIFSMESKKFNWAKMYIPQLLCEPKYLATFVQSQVPIYHLLIFILITSTPRWWFRPATTVLLPLFWPEPQSFDDDCHLYSFTIVFWLRQHPRLWQHLLHAKSLLACCVDDCISFVNCYSEE